MLTEATAASIVVGWGACRCRGPGGMSSRRDDDLVKSIAAAVGAVVRQCRMLIAVSNARSSTRPVMAPIGTVLRGRTGVALHATHIDKEVAVQRTSGARRSATDRQRSTELGAVVTRR